MGLKFGGSYQVNVRLRSLVGYDYTIPSPLLRTAQQSRTFGRPPSSCSPGCRRPSRRTDPS